MLDDPCIVVSTNERIMARQGKRLCDSPKLQWREYIDRKTGIVTKYPAGVDPGFVGNPGRAWAQNKPITLKSPNVKPIGAEPPVLAQPGSTAVAPAVLEKFLREPRGEVQVSAVAPTISRLLPGDASHNRQVILSATTMAKQNANHPDVDKSLYEKLDGLISAPLAVFDNKPLHLRLFGLVGNEAVTAVIKKTGSTHQWYLQSFHAVKERSIQQIAAKQKLLAGDLTEIMKVIKKRVR